MSNDTVEGTDPAPRFSFYKGAEDVVAEKGNTNFDWTGAAKKVRDHLNDALNAKNIAFLLGSGCSSHESHGVQFGIPTMGPMAKAFLGTIGEEGDKVNVSQTERDAIKKALGIDIDGAEYATNLERLMEVLFNAEFVLRRSSKTELTLATKAIRQIIKKITRYIFCTCTEGLFDCLDDTVLATYQAFYRKLIYRDRALPRPWVFTTNYDLFNERAMDRLGIPYCNGFSGTVERRFTPATFRYSLAEQLDLTSRKWTAVEGFVYLCKLHGSISWVEEGSGLYPIRELQQPSPDTAGRIMIYPTPAKQNASFGSPYSDLFREFQTRIVRDQSVLFVLGYSFGDEHVNNIIFQALTIPTFRLVAFAPPDAKGVIAQLRALDDPRIWIIGGDAPSTDSQAHYFDVFVEKFLPEPPGDKVDTAIAKVLHSLITSKKATVPQDGDDDL